MSPSFSNCKLAFGLLISTLSAGAAADHSWGNYHWARNTSSFDLQVVDSVTSDWQSELNNTLSQWSSSSVLNLAITSGDDTSNTRKRCPMVTGQMRVCNAAYGNNGWLGLASIGLDSNGHIDQGTAKVNDTYSSYWQDQTEKNHVMCQEVGHVFGLGHTSEDGSSQSTCMDYSNDPNSQWPNQHDYQMLSDIYNHLDSYKSYDDGGSSDGGSCNAPPGKGCNKNSNGAVPLGVRVHRDHDREVWVAARNDGGLWVHHIRRVPEEYLDH
ncbi:MULTISPECIES: hypothetical protein [unclassified Microbulbifer]|uniref:hypothetical protein n=1 Tax=unclassified Microbulbifer TaxID=2619833 RepID=UPI0027E3BDC6|nr:MULTISPECIES: hypothetical protein [unclassified Microbulbifer]